MDYLFENLGDERFQEFCSSLISKEFPNSQSFPVGQPDGGRDSLVYILNTPKKEFIVFQVKYVRNANTKIDLHKWLTEIVIQEAPKVQKLIPKGAKQFVLLTNVKGTSHLDVGSIDKLNKILEENISIPSICWWRDDLARMLEKDSIFKWSFPEIINGQDVLNSILFQNINENRERRESVIKAYLADQYQMDNEVKFRQIDLQNKLFDLFTDVPIVVKKFNDKNKQLKKTIEYFENIRKRYVTHDEVFIIEEESIGAASFLLNPKVQNGINRMLLEGGPGQGKSTISQYICQVHRARLLNREIDLLQLSEHLKKTPIRIPFKIDLRHVASWVEGKNPYQGRLSDDYFTSIWKNSLESFLLGHIVYHSQIDSFNSGDLIAVTKLSSILFVFDGFDEIADFTIRENVIEFINKGINRLQENTRSIQILITSRPAAFSDTIGFSVDSYPHFELTDVTPQITKEYVEKWIKASRLDSREASEIKRLVDEKLKMPHLKDLAKSPMQLAIFISLLRTRGESLPNKRTALYDSYIDLFFNRESEKNTVIRDNRDLIIDIHQYLAWVLHSEAETLKTSGSIHIDDLKVRLKKYLEKEGHRTEIADQLFHVVEERVCALVSRIQGTYEFEVQPLREYFCAKYLYNTSPYSPPGNEKTGTKAERFDAISRSFYWHNVVRFFAGCFDKGELPLLIEKLKELNEDEILQFTNYPRLLTSQILSDWVFTQYPKLLTDVVKIIINGINVGQIINQAERQTTSEPILLPLECGRAEVVKECFEELKKFPPNDYSAELIGIINNNPFLTIENWLTNLSDISNEKLTQWLLYGYKLQIIHKLDEETLLKIIDNGDHDQKLRRLQICVNGNRFSIIDKNIHYKKDFLVGILDEKFFVPQRQSGSSLHFLSLILHPFLLSNILNDSENFTVLKFFTSRYTQYPRNEKQKLISEFKILDDIDRQVETFLHSIQNSLNQQTSHWKNNIEAWDTLVENGKKIFGDVKVFKTISVIAAGIKSKNQTFEDYKNLNDNSKSLCKRVRYARLKSGNLSYWEDVLNNSNDNVFALLIFFTWATPKTIIQLLNILSRKVKEISDDDFRILVESLQYSTTNSIFNSLQTDELLKSIKEIVMPDEIKFLVSQRLPRNISSKFIYANIKSYSYKFKDATNSILTHLIIKYLEDTGNQEILKRVKEVYLISPEYSEEFWHYKVQHLEQSAKIPIKIAKKILLETKNYPRIIASIAEKSYRVYANQHTIPVGKIASEQNWFD
jgi:hypothetical protein